jgi:hypothetical protein
LGKTQTKKRPSAEQTKNGASQCALDTAAHAANPHATECGHKGIRLRTSGLTLTTPPSAALPGATTPPSQIPCRSRSGSPLLLPSAAERWRGARARAGVVASSRFDRPSACLARVVVVSSWRPAREALSTGQAHTVVAQGPSRSVACSIWLWLAWVSMVHLLAAAACCGGASIIADEKLLTPVLLQLGVVKILFCPAPAVAVLPA